MVTELLEALASDDAVMAADATLELWALDDDHPPAAADDGTTADEAVPIDVDDVAEDARTCALDPIPREEATDVVVDEEKEKEDAATPPDEEDEDEEEPPLVVHATVARTGNNQRAVGARNMVTASRGPCVGP